MPKSTPVKIVEVEPNATTPVKIVEVQPDALKNLKVPQVLPKPLPATTTHQEDITKQGQRRINLIWESTQAVIAVSITWAIIYNAMKRVESPELNYAFFLIVAMYFVRTNHSLIGGVTNTQKGR